MTPFGLRLQLALDLERQRMTNEWFFKWHFIGQSPAVEIDGFNGTKIRYGGIAFTGSARAVYWHTIKLYLKIKVGEIFDGLEAELKAYPKAHVEAAILDTKILMNSFAAGIFHEAIEKDRILRGDGINFPQPDTARAADPTVFPEIEQRANALQALYAPPDHLNWTSKTESFLKEHKEIVAILLLLGGALGTGALELAKIFARKLGWLN